MDSSDLFFDIVNDYNGFMKEINLDSFIMLYTYLFPDMYDMKIFRTVRLNDIKKILYRLNSLSGKRKDILSLKSLKLISLLCNMQPFYDGNHRTMFLLFVAFCNKNHIHFDYISFLREHNCRDLFSILYKNCEEGNINKLELVKKYYN